VDPSPSPGAGAQPDHSAAAWLDEARAILPWMVEIRRDLHRHPELGLEEHRTSARVCELLGELAVEHHQMAGTGVVGIIRGGEGPATALRADLDALPLTEANQTPYSSTVPGRMHACGHDVHTAVLLGAAHLLAAHRAELRHPVKLLFQPAEETVGGAKLLIAEGALEDPPVRAIFGLHVEPDLPVGAIGLRYGQRNASSDDITVTVRGRAGHGAYPAGGVDAIVIAAQVVTALQTVVSRNVDARESAVLTFGTVAGGTQANILANRVQLVGTVRCLDPSIRELVLHRARETAEGVAAGLGGQAEVEIRPSYDPLVNADRMVDVVRRNAAALVGEESLVLFDRPNMGVEDFAFYLARTPGAFYSLGVRNEAAGIVHPIHSDRFDVDEECMALGAALQAMNALVEAEPC
jgi:amidohydrolase